MKKNRAKPAKRHDDRQSDAMHKQDDVHPPQAAGDGLTCGEAQIEDLLSEGEST